MEITVKVKEKVVLALLKNDGYSEVTEEAKTRHSKLIEAKNPRCGVALMVYVNNGVVTAISTRVSDCTFPEEELRAIETYQVAVIETCAA